MFGGFGASWLVARIVSLVAERAKIRGVSYQIILLNEFRNSIKKKLKKIILRSGNYFDFHITLLIFPTFQLN